MIRRYITLLALMPLVAGPLMAQAPLPPAVLKLPPSLSAAGTGVVVGGAAWGYVVWQATSPDWYQKNDVAIYLKPGDAESSQPFVLQGTMAPLTDPAAIVSWVNRATRLAGATGGLAENVGICKARAQDLIGLWSPVQPPVIPGALVDCLSIIAGRAAQEPDAAATLRAMGNSHPVYRFLTGTGWAGPLGVSVGQDATIELRQISRATRTEGAVVARVTLRAVTSADSRISPDLVTPPDAVVQVRPDWPANPPAAEGVFNIPPQTTLPDLAPALRWSFPDELRRQVLLSRGFMLWRGNTSITMNTAGDLISNFPQLTKILRNPAPASKLFSALNGTSSGPQVDNFSLDRSTWFFADDNQRYDFQEKPMEGEKPIITGTPHAINSNHFYYTAAADLLGRYGPPSLPRASIAFRTIPPAVPKIEAVENIVSNGGQRLRIAFKPSIVPPGGVPVHRYLIFRDRAINTTPGSQSLDASIDPTRNNEMIYIGQVNQVPNPGPQSEITFIDQALSPVFPNHFGLTYYYCIRAVSDVPSFGMNISPPSAPVFGTVRDRQGPPPPSGYVSVEAARPAVTFLDQAATITDNADVPPDTTLFRFRFTRQDPGVASIRLSIVRHITASEGGFIPLNPPLLHFGKSNSLDYDYPFGGARADSLVISVTAISANGRVSHYTTVPVNNLSSFQTKKNYTIELGSATGGVTDMVPELNFLWQPYFRKPSDNTPSLYAISPIALGDGTYSATFPGTVDGTRSRSLLIQRRPSAAGAWSNLTSARLPAGLSQFNFPVEGVLLPNAQYRVWEVIDPPGSPDISTYAHDPTPANSGVVQPIKVTLIAPAGASEYRIYRKIDKGPLFLLKQDTGTWDPATVKTTVLNDSLIPPAGGTFSYFGQTFDQNGNPSALVLLDQKVGVIPELPVPVVDVLESGGTAGDPRMIVRASCPSPGVERAEIIITPTPEFTSTLITKPAAEGLLFNFTPGASPSAPQLFNTTAVSSAVTADLSSQPFIFSDSIRIKAGVEYTFQIRVLGIYGTQGLLSSEQKFTWTEPIAGSAVPWPTRATPPSISWNPQIQAFRNLPEYQEIRLSPTDTRTISDITPGFRPIAVQIGTIPLTSTSPKDVDNSSNWYVFRASRPDSSSLNLLALSNVAGADASPPGLFKQFLAPKSQPGGDVPTFDYSQKLFPVVLYRQQTQRLIGGSTVAVTDADLVQVSPMIENIAWVPSPGAATIVDPYVGLLERQALTAPNPYLSLCLFDCSPVTTGATYRYYLVHFDPGYEPDVTIDAGAVTIPSDP